MKKRIAAIALLCGMAIPSNAWANGPGEKGKRRGKAKTESPHAPPPAPYGLEFGEEAVIEAMRRVESGDGPAAIERVQKALKSAAGGTEGRRLELRLGLGAAALRVGRWKEARSDLGPLSRMREEREVRSRAAVLMNVLNEASGDGARDDSALQSATAWREALKRAHARISGQLAPPGAELIDACAAGRLAAYRKPLEQSRDLLDQLRAIRVEDAASATADAAAGHARRLAQAVEKANRRIRELNDRAKLLRRQTRAKTAQGKELPSPEAIGQYNALCGEIGRALEATDAIIAEYHAIQKEFGLKPDKSVKRALDEPPKTRRQI
jgi:hypothetical protein